MNNPIPDFQASHRKSCKRWRFRWRAKQSFLLLSRQRRKWRWSRWRRWRGRRGEEDPGWFDWNESKQSWLSRKVCTPLSATDWSPLNRVTFLGQFCQLLEQTVFWLRGVSCTKNVASVQNKQGKKTIITGPICSIGKDSFVFGVIQMVCDTLGGGGVGTVSPNVTWGRVCV